MKKLVILLASFTLIGFNAANAQDAKDDKKVLIKEIVTATLDQLKAAGLPEESLTKFADCYEKDIDSKLNIDEVKFLVKLTKLKEGDTPSEEDMAKISEMESKLSNLGVECQSELGM